MKILSSGKEVKVKILNITKVKRGWSIKTTHETIGVETEYVFEKDADLIDFIKSIEWRD